MQTIMVRPGRFCQVSHGRRRFCLIVDDAAVHEFAVEQVGPYDSYDVVGVAGPEELDQLLATVDLAETEVLVVSRHGLSRGLSPRHVDGARRVGIVACDTTPTTPEQVGYLISSLERCASERQVELADRLRTTLWSSSSVRIASESTSTTATLTLEPDWLWVHDSFGAARRPAVALSVGPEPSIPSVLEIHRGDAERLPVTGRITVKGRPIVRTLGLGEHVGGQSALYEALLAMVGTPLLLDVHNGRIGEVSAADDGNGGSGGSGGSGDRAGDGGGAGVRALTEFLDRDERHREITQIGVGIDTEMQPFAGNSEANLVYGGPNGRLYLVLGALGESPFEVILPAETSSLTTEDGTILAGTAAAKPRRRLNRVNSPSCGCH